MSGFMIGLIVYAVGCVLYLLIVPRIMHRFPEGLLGGIHLKPGPNRGDVAAEFMAIVAPLWPVVVLTFAINGFVKSIPLLLSSDLVCRSGRFIMRLIVPNYGKGDSK